MDIKELKKMLKKSTAVLILDEGEPSFVVVDYNLYKDILAADDNTESKGNGLNFLGKSRQEGSGQSVSGNELEILERINKDIQALKNEIENEGKNLVEELNL